MTSLLNIAIIGPLACERRFFLDRHARRAVKKINFYDAACFCADAAPTQHRAPTSTAAATLCFFPFIRVCVCCSIARDEPAGPFI